MDIGIACSFQPFYVPLVEGSYVIEYPVPGIVPFGLLDDGFNFAFALWVVFPAKVYTKSHVLPESLEFGGVNDVPEVFAYRQ